MSHDSNPPRAAQRHHSRVSGRGARRGQRLPRQAPRAGHGHGPRTQRLRLRARLLPLREERLAAGHTGLRAQTGENIFWAGDAEALPGSRAVNKWYNEIAAYDFAAAQFSSAAGHFTQLVWKASTKVGIARVAGQPGEYFETYIVFVFEERGNMTGAFAGNVLPA
ncbi:CAP domain-containing protein [Nonomuraea sp. GTA35]|uniref:CAP domain-containing protein n=1 Tax=Nonomuraea sp. GTA35 TaxID=1676746 RepID=UPI0035C21327